MLGQLPFQCGNRQDVLVEDAGCQGAVNVAGLEHVDEMPGRAGAAGGDQRNIADSAGRRQLS